MEAHNAAVQAISAQMKSFYDRKAAFRNYHGSTNSTRQYKVDRSKMVDTSALTHVISTDREKSTCLVEPNVPMDQLFDETFPHGLMPPVVMEFPGITVGGGFVGTGSESSGFRYGFFDRTAVRIEMVLPDGEIVTASPNERSDLFYGAAGTFGTLGVLTLVEIQLIPARPYVELTYHPVKDFAGALELIKRTTSDESIDYVDGITLALDRTVVISGKLTETVSANGRIQTFGQARDPWFYIHVERTTRKTTDPVKVYVPTRDYLFRYDRGAFWMGSYAYKYFLTPFNRVTRWALDYFMHTRVMYQALHASGHGSEYIIQDLMLPFSTAEKFVQYIDQQFGFYPLWLCPLRKGSSIAMDPKLLSSEPSSNEMFLNIGVWGPWPKRYPRFIQDNRALEQKVRELGGIKWLYAQTFYTLQEFWDIYNRQWYEQLREKYHADHLPSVYDKVRVDVSRYGESEATWPGWLRNRFWETWPVSGVYGVLTTLWESDFLLAK
ncbi:FAD-binding domain-containing protein [Polychaeton citri CBS 116435]|uniref:Delta(24)-sterol reductase n=1 Tax=Polychaeton citri CBS 116435 TaxID=1314669 RepID=A0A9P4Q1C5_9PEZI|nr:FAD-binding domain-containing protein [Polychaeton citri CBS 116435]